MCRPACSAKRALHHGIKIMAHADGLSNLAHALACTCTPRTRMCACTNACSLCRQDFDRGYNLVLSCMSVGLLSEKERRRRSGEHVRPQSVIQQRCASLW
jgi:hypothetical protein